MALVADCARRLAIANPTMDDPLLGEGIILIDEVDLHLHPAWQRMVLPQLTKTFPNCQIIVSTHSPQILGEVDATQIRILTQNEENLNSYYIPTQAKGLTSNDILDELMSPDGNSLIRNAVISEKLTSIFEHIDNDEFAVAQQQIDVLKETLHGDIPELVQAEALITMLNTDEKGTEA